MLALFLSVVGAQAPEPRVELIRTPANGIQPRAAVDEQGTLDLVYFRGDAEAGELEYVRSTDGGKTFDEPVRVNSRPSSAVALGNVRGAQIALGRGGRVHVAWNGTLQGESEDSPMLYTRLAGSGRGFEPERDVAGEHHGLDGGGAVAADAAGNVWVVWHAPDGGQGESDRRVYVAHSKDDGATFEPEIAASKKGPGVCPCCGLGASVNGDGGLAILYRTACDGDHRDTVLLYARELGDPFRPKLVDEWRVPT